MIVKTHQTLKDGALLVVGRLWCGRSRLRFKLPGFSDNEEIQYCNQPVLDIALDLNVAYSVLWLLISFREAPWKGFVCYVLDITTTGRGYCGMSTWLTIHIATVSYQQSFFCKINLMRFICWYCTLVWNKYIILLCFICNHHKTLLISQISNKFLRVILKHIVLLQTTKSTPFQILRLSTHVKHWKTELYLGSADFGEGDQDSDLNSLDSVIIRQYNTVTNQC